MRVSFFLVGLLIAAPVSAQTGTLVGRVTDAATGEPLPGATVSVVSMTIGAATETNGRYRIEQVPAGERTIRVSFVGYALRDTTVIVRAGMTVTLDATLVVAMDNLGEVTVDGNAEARAVRESPFAVTAIDAQNRRAAAGRARAPLGRARLGIRLQHPGVGGPARTGLPKRERGRHRR